MTQYENGTAILEGAVVDMDDPNRGLDLHFYFQNRTAGTAWGGGFKNDYGCAVNTCSMDALSLSPSVDGTAVSNSAPGTLVVAAPPSVPMVPIDAAARAVANSSQTPTGDASKSTGKRKTMEQQTELSTTCPV